MVTRLYLLGFLFLFSTSTLQAKPIAVSAFCETYPQVPACLSGQASCETCHTVPPHRHTYGTQIHENLLPEEERPLSNDLFLEALPEVLTSIEELDADEDGFSNLQEIEAGSLMHDATHIPVDRSCTTGLETTAPLSGEWNLCGYDPIYAFKRIRNDVCGVTPSRKEIEAFRSLEDWKAVLMETFELCVQTNYWRGEDGVVWRLAHKKVKPQAGAKSGKDSGAIPLADYEDDYNLFLYVHLDGRDVRDLLLAQYHVKRRKSGNTTFYDKMTQEEENHKAYAARQNAPVARRAGMITTRWFLVMNTMFTAIPRNTAAQAYRSYLGYDLAHMEGIFPTEEELIDYDDKGVTQEECAACHDTLDALAYPFSRYNGIQPPFGGYNESRLNWFIGADGDLVTQTPEAGRILDFSVANLVEWARAAANSDDFVKTVVHDYWEYFIGQEPQPEDLAEFTELWKRLKTVHNYSVHAMLKELILTEAYGAP